MDERTGEIYDYSRKRGVEYSELVFPSGVSMTRANLWNLAEVSENRRNSTVAREYEVALPEELTSEQRKALAVVFARHLTDRYGVAADVAIHSPSRGGDSRNHHAHILTTTRVVTMEGFGAKTRALDDKKTGEVEYVRRVWAILSNQALEQAGHESQIDHRSLQSQGVEREPMIHLGPVAIAMERRGEPSERGDLNRGLGSDRLMKAELEEAERISAGTAKAKVQAKEWLTTQEQVKARALAQERAEQQEREAHEQEQLVREKAESRNRDRGGMKL